MEDCPNKLKSEKVLLRLKRKLKDNENAPPTNSIIIQLQHGRLSY